MSNNQVWRIIFFFQTNRPKMLFSQTFPGWKMSRFFPYISRLLRNHGVYLVTQDVNLVYMVYFMGSV